jgi:hypothetical protein
VCVCVLLSQKNPISFVEIYSDTFLWMLLTSLSTTNPLKLLEETKRDTEKENQGEKKSKKEKMVDYTVTFATFISFFCA